MAIFKKRRKHYTTPTCNASKGAEVIPKTLQKILEGISSYYSLHPNLHASQNTERSRSLKNVGAQKIEERDRGSYPSSLLGLSNII
jgi:hypothetical protein